MTIFNKNSRPIKPARLKHGDMIGIISPAGFIIERSELESGLDILLKAGFQVCPAPHVYDQEQYMAGKDADRLNDLHDMIASPDIKAVFCARGGYGSMRLLDHIQYDLFAKNPKIIVGYSDITALLLAIYSQTGLIGFHGPVVRELGVKDPANPADMLHCLSIDQPLEKDLSECDVIIPGKAHGPLLGGNLSLITHLLGTPYLPSFKGAILFLEDRGESLYRLDRMLTHLGLTGQLDDLNGIILGQFPDCGDMEEIRDLFQDRLARFNIPLIVGFPAGHGNSNVTFPIGMTAILNTDPMTLIFSETCTR